MSSIFERLGFSGNKQQPVQQPNIPAGGQKPNEQQVVKPNEQPPKDKPGEGTPKVGEEQNTPMEKFANMWDPPEGDKGGGAKPTSFLNVDPKRIKESAKGLKYSSLIPPEMATKALGGDVASLMEILDTVGQAGFSHAMTAGLQLTERGLGAAHARIMGDLPNELKKHSVSSHALRENPNLNHKAVKPLLSVIQAQLQEKFPDATEDEINGMSREYLMETSKLLSGNSQEEADPSKKPSGSQAGLQKEQDWGKLFGLEEPPTS